MEKSGAGAGCQTDGVTRSGPGQLACPHPLRRHQAEALAAIDTSLAGGHTRLWVTMPPGAGKTLVGTELIATLARRAVVFSPNTAIQGQWAATWDTYGGDPTGTERDLAAPVTSLTYQSLAVFDGERGSDDDGPVTDRLHENGRALIESLRAAGPILLVLDECHHLLEVWGQLLREVLDRLPDAVVLGLTATPPGAMTQDQAALTAELFGPILYEARIPALVKEGTLAPYAELALLVTPTTAEDDWLAEQSTRFAELTTDLFTPGFGSTPFPQWTRKRFVDVVASGQTDWDAIARSEPELSDAALRLVHAGLLELPPGASVREPHRHHLTAEDWRLLLDDWLVTCVSRADTAEDAAVLEVCRRALPAVGYVWTRTGVRRGRGTLDRVLARSASKETATATILGAEHRNLGDRTRALVLCDHERATATTSARLTADDPPQQAGSATGVLRTLLADPATATLAPLLVTGSTVAAAEATLLSLREQIREANPRLAARLLVEEDGDLCRLVGPWSSGAWVRAVTRFFTAGGTRALIGTRGLLGEGWDAPAVTTLVDLTIVTTSTAVVQTRGRALRIDPAWPEKVALVWSVVCASERHVSGGTDWARFVRKHIGYFTVDESGTVVDGVAGIDSGFDAYEPPPVTTFDAVTARMLVRAEDRDAVREAWLESPAYGDRVTHTVRVTSGRVPTAGEPGRALATVGPAAVVARDGRRSPWFPGWPTAVAAALLVAALVLGSPVGVVVALLVGSLGQTGVAAARGRALLRDAARPPTYAQVGAALADAMRSTGRSTIGSEGVRTSVRADGEIEVLLDGVDETTSAAFAAAFEEVVSPMAEPRYLLPRWVVSPPPDGAAGLRTGLRAALGRHRPEGEVWHTVPRLLSTRRADADAFATAWDHWVGGGAAVYAKSPEGYGVLVTHRGEDPFAATCVIRRVWH